MIPAPHLQMARAAVVMVAIVLFAVACALPVLPFDQLLLRGWFLLLLGWMSLYNLSVFAAWLANPFFAWSLLCLLLGKDRGAATIGATALVLAIWPWLYAVVFAGWMEAFDGEELLMGYFFWIAAIALPGFAAAVFATIRRLSAVPQVPEG